MNLHKVNMSKFMLLINLKYTISPSLLNISLNSGYTETKTSIGFFKDFGEVKGREMIILLLLFKIFMLNNTNIQVTKFNQLEYKGFYNPYFPFFSPPVGRYI